MKAIPLGGRKARGRHAFVDDADYALVSSYKWHLIERQRPSGGIDGPYARTTTWDAVNRRTVAIRMHKMITGYPRTDHIDHDGLNNQRYNLRPATAAQNGQNARPQGSSSSAYKGVTWHRQVGKWQAMIKCHYLGVFESELAAALAYDQAALEAYGEYAYLNIGTS